MNICCEPNDLRSYKGNNLLIVTHLNCTKEKTKCWTIIIISRKRLHKFTCLLSVYFYTFVWLTLNLVILKYTHHTIRRYGGLINTENEKSFFSFF